MNSPAHLDLLAPDFDFDSAEVSRARDRHWYANSPIGPVVLRHKHVSNLLTDRRLRLGGEAYMAHHRITAGPLYRWWMASLLSAEGQAHARLRRPLRKAFTRAMVEELRPFVRRTANELADRLGPDQAHDFVGNFADPLAARVMCHLLAVPEADYEQFHGWARDIGLAFAVGRLSPALLSRIDRSVHHMGDYVADLIEHRRTHPGSDLLSALVAEQHHPLTPDEVTNLAVLLVWAGQDTTSRQLGRALIAFADHPRQWDLLARDPSLRQPAVHEIFRWTPQARVIQRFAKHDLVYEQLDLPQGSPVFCCIASAGRDPDAFTDASRFDIRTPRPTRQITFGGGIHYCLGAALGTLEIHEALATLTQRFGPPARTGDAVWRPPLAMIHGPDSLPLTFTAKTREKPLSPSEL